jgi:hypothetical protein
MGGRQSMPFHRDGFDSAIENRVLKLSETIQKKRVESPAVFHSIGDVAQHIAKKIECSVIPIRRLLEQLPLAIDLLGSLPETRRLKNEIRGLVVTPCLIKKSYVHRPPQPLRRPSSESAGVMKRHANGCAN